MFNGKTVLITGGTGSFGKKFIEILLKKYAPKKVIVYSRDELKQFEMQQKFNQPCMRYFIGDVRDDGRLKQAMYQVDYVVHAPALKQVSAAEYIRWSASRQTCRGPRMSLMRRLPVASRKQLRCQRIRQQILSIFMVQRNSVPINCFRQQVIWQGHALFDLLSCGMVMLSDHVGQLCLFLRVCWRREQRSFPLQTLV